MAGVRSSRCLFLLMPISRILPGALSARRGASKLTVSSNLPAALPDVCPNTSLSQTMIKVPRSPSLVALPLQRSALSQSLSQRLQRNRAPIKARIKELVGTPRSPLPASPAPSAPADVPVSGCARVSSQCLDYNGPCLLAVTLGRSAPSRPLLAFILNDMGV